MRGLLKCLSWFHLRISESRNPKEFYMLAITKSLKGSFTIFLFLVRSHILNSNKVWY